MAEIQLHHVHKRFDDFVAVRDTQLQIEDGEFFVLLGPSGCGKTTTLRMIAGLELPTSGEIRLDGTDVTYRRPARRDIAFVFQLYALYEHMNVRRNIAFPLRVQGVPRAERDARVAEVARLLRITPLLDRGLRGLSSGDRQRVALGRAIIRRPAAFLMDEPLGALDAEFRQRMAEELRQLHDKIGATTVYVTHDQVEAMAMADRIAVMDHGEVVQVGSPMEVYDRPNSMFVASFLGSPRINFLHGGRLDANADEVRLSGATLPTPHVVDLESPDVSVGIRPEHVAISQSGPLRGEVFGVEYMGPRQLVTVQTEAGLLRVSTGHDVRVELGERVGMTVARERMVLFDASTGRALRPTPPIGGARV